MEGAELTEHPFELQRVLPPADKLRLRCDLQFSEAADEDKRSAVFEGSFELQAASGRSSEGLDAPPATKWRTFLTQVRALQMAPEPVELGTGAILGGSDVDGAVGRVVRARRAGRRSIPETAEDELSQSETGVGSTLLLRQAVRTLQFTFRYNRWMLFVQE